MTRGFLPKKAGWFRLDEHVRRLSEEVENLKNNPSSNSTTYLDTFTYGGGEQVFNLSNSITNDIYVTVNGQVLRPSEYTYPTSTSIEIMSTLDVNDFILVKYSYTVNDAYSYTKTEIDNNIYTKSEVDSIVSEIEGADIADVEEKANKAISDNGKDYYQELGETVEARKATLSQNNYGILMAGQSNMNGNAPYSYITDNSLPTTTVRTNEWNGSVFGAMSLPVANWGIYWSILYRLDAYLTKNVYYYKKAVGGSNLHTDWNANTNNMNAYPNQLATEYNEMKAALATLNLKCLIWIQGESDTATPHDTNYYQNLKNFVSFIRGVVKNPLLKVIVVGMHPSQTSYDANVRAGQVALAAEDLNVVFINPDSLAFTHIGDNQHYDGEYNELLGDIIFNVIKDY